LGERAEIVATVTAILGPHAPAGLPSPNCDRIKNRPSAPAADSAQVHFSRYAESLVTARVTCRQIARSQAQELLRLCPLFADRAQEGDKQTGLGRTW
jgi:hypothetical protein